MFANTGYSNPNFTLDLGDKFDTSNVTNMRTMFSGVGFNNDSFELDLSTFDFNNVTSYYNMFLNWKPTQKIYVKDAADQSWVIDKNHSALTTNNVLIKT